MGQNGNLLIYTAAYIARTLERLNCSKVNGGPQLENTHLASLIGLESKTGASVKQPQTEIKCNMLVAD